MTLRRCSFSSLGRGDREDAVDRASVEDRVRGDAMVGLFAIRERIHEGVWVGVEGLSYLWDAWR